MNFPPDVVTGEIHLLIGPRAEREAMLRLIAILALRGPVHVLDGGNSFNAYQAARLIRRHTPHLNEVLDRIFLARAFTCYQVVTLFEQTLTTMAPQLVLDLLSTFYDENVSIEESARLLRIVIGHLHRFKTCAPVAISIHPPHQPERNRLVEMLMQAADRVFMKETPTPSPQPRLL